MVKKSVEYSSASWSTIFNLELESEIVLDHAQSFFFLCVTFEPVTSHGSHSQHLVLAGPLQVVALVEGYVAVRRYD